ncbi:MAG TPA: hypothetical protein PKG78_00820 [Candidatus Woesebacteria bacterium]|jgi:hypothetical protein|nr:hypothetical protein [Candidatus Woesebacteria bacterium]HOA11898.1 hypothetical protein [Candidatus Woesebacteria bacterium]
MPSKKRKSKTKKRQSPQQRHQLFWPLLVLIFVFWFLYRILFSFSVFFDELVGKAIFFAFPVLIYLTLTGFSATMETLSFAKLKRGLLIGLMLGGVLGFVAVITKALLNSGHIEPLAFYAAENFWWEMFLAMLTSFFETLFFFSFVMLVIEDRYPKWSLFKKVLVVAFIFLIFHLPNLFLRFSLETIYLHTALLFAFALGQSLLFYAQRNAYTLLMTQAIWGMVLLIHF